jgi:hypothetical protein
LSRLKGDAGFTPAERQSFAISGLSPADASEPVGTGDFRRGDGYARPASAIDAKVWHRAPLWSRPKARGG